MNARTALAALVLAGCAATTPSPQPIAVDVVRAPTAEPVKPVAPPPAPAPAPKPPPPKVVAPAPAKVAAPPPPKPAAPPPLDLKALEQRLKDTSAIGVLTKLSLKNQVDDLVDRFKTFHAGRRPPTLADLRPPFDLLLMKVLSLLQDHDAALARDIDASRDAIWSVLADRDKFAKYSSQGTP